jgi:CheY-like chemotaxis protein
MDKKRILIVDDERSFTRMVKLNLEKTGFYEVREENRGTLAVPAAREFRPHLILLDVIMPDRDGGDVLARLQADPELRQIPVIFITAAVHKREAGDKGKVSGGSVFLAKPIGLKDLVAAIEAALVPPATG